MKRGDLPETFTLIFTDLDGTLLDHDTYEWKAAEPALKRCGQLGIPVIPVSSKTGAEIDGIRRRIGLSAPFISENGGGIFFPEEGALEPPPDAVLATFSPEVRKLSLGASYDVLVRSLRDLRKELGWTIQGFSDMTPEDISRLTGLDLKASRLAAQREYNEPFIIGEEENIDLKALEEAVTARGLRLTAGGRFFHLHGRTDKGDAVDRLTALYRTARSDVLTVGLGDSPNDFSMLKRVDHPRLIRSSRRFPGMEQEIPNIRITREPGPKGWNHAVLEILNKKTDGGVA